jgi:hypothetical protein
MAERILCSNTAVQGCLELLGEGALTQARDVLFAQVASGEVANAGAWGLLSVLTTDRAEAERYLEQVSRLLYVDHQGTGKKELGVTDEGSETHHRLGALSDRSAQRVGATRRMGQPMSLAPREPRRGSQTSQKIPAVARPSASGHTRRDRASGVSLPTFSNANSPAAPSLRRVIHLTGGALSILLVLVMLSVIALLLAPRVVGAHLLVVQSQSMEPVVPMGALVVSLPVSASEIAVGDVVTYESYDLGEGLAFRDQGRCERGGRPRAGAAGRARRPRSADHPADWILGSRNPDAVGVLGTHRSAGPDPSAGRAEGDRVDSPPSNSEYGGHC